MNPNGYKDSVASLVPEEVRNADEDDVNHPHVTGIHKHSRLYTSNEIIHGSS